MTEPLSVEEQAFVLQVAAMSHRIYDECASWKNSQAGTLLSTLTSVWLAKHVEESRWQEFISLINTTALRGAHKIKGELRGKLQ